MGAACCVAAKDKPCSPTWSFRWDHRGRVAGEDTFSHDISRNHGSQHKNQSEHVSEDGSPSQNRCQKSPISEGSAAHVRDSTSDQSISRTVSMDVCVSQVNELALSPIVYCPSSTNPSLPSISLSASPLSSQYHMSPSNLTPSRWPYRSQGHQLLRQTSDSRILTCKSPSCFSLSEERPVFPSGSNESGMRSHGGSSDGWSIPCFSELMGTSDGWSIPCFSELMGTPHRGRWSFGSESVGSNNERSARSSSCFSTSTFDLRTCGICSKLLIKKSSWSTQRIIASNDLTVVAVLICGHVYHAECLDTMTPDVSKYDPACPVCSFGEKQTKEFSKKALVADVNLKARKKKLKNRVVDSDIDDDFVVFDLCKGNRFSDQGPGVDSSSSGKSSFRKPFLSRHFSFGSNGSRSTLDNQLKRKKGFFWSKSCKV